MDRSQFAAIGCSLSLAAAASAQQLYGIEFTSGNLIRINTTTGTTSLIGSTGVTNPGGLDLATDGSLLTVSVEADPGLYRISAVDGSSQLLGRLGASFEFEGGLAIADATTGYFVGGRDTADGASLYRLDLTTGAATEVGTLGIRDINGLTFRRDGQLVAFASIGSTLLSIDPTTAAVDTSLGFVTTFGPIGGLASIDGSTAWISTGPTSGPGSSGNARLYAIDLFTGAIIGDSISTPRGISGIAVPGPGSAGVVALAGLCASRRRR